MEKNKYDASVEWRKALTHEGYEHSCRNRNDLNQLRNLGRVWMRILRETSLSAPARMFELGCGGGIYLARLSLNGFITHGIDVSPEVTKRAKVFLGEVSAYQSIAATVETANIFEYELPKDLYDACFHFGVVEHFLEYSQRAEIWRRMCVMTKPGGWLVSVVPCGVHIMRKMMREKSLAGYCIPEIDYSCEFHIDEFRKAGLYNIRATPHNYFSFFSAHPSKLVSKCFYPMAFGVGNTLLPLLPLSNKTKERFSHSLIVMGQKMEAA